jgi:uroporphyrin-III C-methyltransferase
VKGLKVIQQANVILYDALVHPDLLDFAKSDSEKIFVGKRAGKHSLIQEQINSLIVKHALEGKHVVRLKGGDPFVFGRGKEEIEYAETFGIETEAVLGISSINLPGYYGIPLTRRGINESFWAITATTKSGKMSEDVRLVAKSTATAIFFMGLNKLQKIVDIYKEELKQDIPVAIISKGSLPDGQVVYGTINTIVAEKERNNIAAPAIIVVGKAVGTYKYFEQDLISYVSN